ncbi:MAG TPA: cytochrome c, partial [Gemmatimonadaceae bacterium]
MILLMLGATSVLAQEDPVRRVANIVSVAVAEYGKGVDAQGRRVDAAEQQEAVDFLREARSGAAALTGDQMANARAVLDSLIGAAEAARPPRELAAMQQRFAALLGSRAALEVPRSSIDVIEGRALFDKRCASCHGALGKGDGRAAAGIVPKPPAIGDPVTMRNVTPAMMYRITSVGISGTQMTGWADVLTPEQRWNVVWYLMSLRYSQAQVATGETVFSRDLRARPPEIGSFAWQVEQSDDQLARQVRL